MIALDTSAECTEEKQYRVGSVMLGATSVGVDVVGNKAGGGPAARSRGRECDITVHCCGHTAAAIHHGTRALLTQDQHHPEQPQSVVYVVNFKSS